jgi:site-specific DNA-methyltransferase (adenine-specific)
VPRNVNLANLPKPYFEDESVTIYHGDCRELLPLMPKVDLVLTDPPYGIGLAANPFRQKHAKADWDDEPVTPELLDSVIRMADESIVWGGNYFGLPAHQCFLIWDKVQPESFSSAMVEQAWTNLSGPAKMFARHVVSYEKWHPTQKPVELMRWAIGRASAPQTILNPFMGSGTTLRAAKDLGRKAIGIELEERYCEIAAKRMSQGVLL